MNKKEYDKKWRKDNPHFRDKWNAEHPEYRKRYRQEHAERHNEQGKRWREDNKEKVAISRKQWSNNNPTYQSLWRKTEKGRACTQRKNVTRRVRLREVINTLTAKEWSDILEQYNYKCAYCRRSILDLPDGLVRDHVIPISRGGSNTKENIVPSCVNCNTEKHTQLIKEILSKGKEVEIVA